MESEEDSKTLKSINLDDCSIEDLEEYIQNLTLETKRADLEIKKRVKAKDEAENFF